MQTFTQHFKDALAGGDIASVLLCTAGGDKESIRDAIRGLCPSAQAAGVAFLVEGHADLAAELGCDGVQVPAGAQELRSARRILGSDRIVGADCGASRHLAMVAGEQDCDFVAFKAQELDALAWWAELMEIPCIACGDVTLGTAPAIVATGVEFLAADRAVWDHPEGPQAAVAAFNALLATP